MMLALVAAWVLIIHVVVGLMGDDSGLDGRFLDGDSYMRVMRVIDLLATGDWWDHTFERANAPWGFTSHWTRPFDLVVGALALPMVPFVGMAEAVHWAGYMVSPMVHALFAVALVWAVMPLLGTWAAVVAGLLTTTHAGLVKLCGFGVADHHAFFLLITTVILGLTLRSLIVNNVGPDHRWSAALGVLAALAVWAGPESLVLIGLVLSVTGLAWLSGDPEGLRRHWAMLPAFAAGILMFLVLDRGMAEPWGNDTDRISLVHLALSLALLAAWGLMALTERRFQLSLTGRAVLAVSAAAGVAGAMVILFPRVIGGPEVDIDPLVQRELISRVSEVQPVKTVSEAFILVGGVLFALPVLIWRLRCVAGRAEKLSWLMITLGCVVYLGFTMVWLRWAPYAGLFLAIPLADLIVQLDRAINARTGSFLRVLIKVPAFVAIAVGPLLIGGLSADDGTAAEIADVSKECPVEALAPVLSRPPWGNRPRTFMAPANVGPELLYRTRHRVVATVHHRNDAGLRANWDILRATDPEISRALMVERGIDLVLMCPDYRGNGFVLATDTDDRLFYRRLLQGRGPSWIREVEVPSEAGRQFRLFEVVSPPAAR